MNQRFVICIDNEDYRLNVFERMAPDDRHYWQARTWLQKRTTGLRLRLMHSLSPWL